MGFQCYVCVRHLGIRCTRFCRINFGFFGKDLQLKCEIPNRFAACLLGNLLPRIKYKTYKLNGFLKKNSSMLSMSIRFCEARNWFEYFFSPTFYDPNECNTSKKWRTYICMFWKHLQNLCPCPVSIFHTLDYMVSPLDSSFIFPETFFYLTKCGSVSFEYIVYMPLTQKRRIYYTTIIWLC